MKYAVEMGPGAMIYIPSFLKIGSGTQTLIGGVTKTGRRSHKKISDYNLIPVYKIYKVPNLISIFFRDLVLYVFYIYLLIS
jgi:hypothetical protein